MKARAGRTQRWSTWASRERRDCASRSRIPERSASVISPIGGRRHCRVSCCRSGRCATYSRRTRQSPTRAEGGTKWTYSGESVRPQFWQIRLAFEEAVEPASDEVRRALPELRDLDVSE